MSKMVKAQQRGDAAIKTILEEVRQLRHEISFFLPQESLAHFNNPRRVKKSYERASRQFPPRV